ncbi:MAG: Rrf2 family transcriptional regulator [Deltaproteobacteria bacterium]|nr:Rrf2 family transcriptional regulator [Deltaproteobacteria bacterium]MBW2413948.1 Rrf2 family transcriptional regulator [Deltaproteobacteria bacterium]
MQLLAQEEYGLRCLLQVAAHPETRPITIPEIAEAEGLSAEYTGKLMRALRQGGLVDSTRGAGGGYRLARAADQITPWDVIQALGGPFFNDDFCDAHPGRLRDCVHSTDCSVRALWMRVESAVQGVLGGVTLADMTRTESQMAVWVEAPGPPTPPRPAGD